ncbi:MAG: phosphotransferase [candidate division Zixibacteria bacterium]|nr:phosphotransferase [candidate division Zixibacteria bacterium]
MEGIKENFKFLIAETQKQVNATLDLLVNPDGSNYEKIYNRDDYIDNLKTIIENKCFARINATINIPDKEINEIRAIHIAGVNLERIADNCVNIIRQFGYLEDFDFINSYSYKDQFDLIRDALSRINRVLENSDMTGALTICKAEHELDEKYKVIFDRIMSQLKTGQNTQNLITTLFIFRYLERIGDSLLNIGEALIFAIVGEKIKIHQFQSLQRVLSKSGFDGDISDIDFQGIWGTKSGCHISRLEQRPSSTAETRESIFKEGNLQKIKAEKDNLEKWGELFPGLTPRVYSYNEDSGSASILVEFLPGHTFDESVINADEELLRSGFISLRETVRRVWTETRKDEAISTDYIKQILTRLEHINQLHPELNRFELDIGQTKIRSSNELFEIGTQIEREIKAPFSVLIHGDFNANNIIFDYDINRIYFIDLYRSRSYDYVQDISVFLVSNFRIPVFAEELRARLNWIIEKFYSFARGMAEDWNDDTFEARLTLALARSFYTSTRFELNFEFAKEMCLRAYYLLEKLFAHKQGNIAWEKFHLPQSVLYY